MMIQFSRFLTVALIATSLAISGCNARASVLNAAAPPPAPEVSVMTVNGEDTPIYADYTAQTFARDMVEVRGRAAAIHPGSAALRSGRAKSPRRPFAE